MRVLHYVDDNVLSWAKPYIQLLTVLKNHGCENVIVCRPEGTLSDMLRNSGFDVREYKPLFSSLPETARGFRKILLNVKPDIIHTRLSSAAYIGGYWGKKFHIPILSTVDKYPKRKYYDNASLILPCSSSVYEYMLSCGIPAERMTVIHNAADVDSYARDEKRRADIRNSEGLHDNSICFLGMGRFVDWKGFDDLLNAFAVFLKRQNNPERFFLWLAGDGPERKKLESLAHNLNVHEHVKFWGFIEDVRPVLWGADVYVHPSWGEEAFGLSLLEAISAGLPSVVSRNGGMTDILDESQCLFFGRRDINELAECMNDILAMRNELSLESLRRSREFDAEIIAQKTMNAYMRFV